MSQIVSNSSPLISLAAAGHLPLLKHLADELLVPEQVWRECVLEGHGKPGADAIALAKQLGTPVVMDERRGRAAARREGIPVIGTAGGLLRLEDIGVLAAVGPIMQELISAGWRVSDELLRGTLQAAGE